MKTLILLSFIILSISLNGYSTIWIITDSGNTFTPNTITINQGDTVSFVLSSLHNVLEVNQATYNSNGTTALAGGFQTPFGGGMILPANLNVGTHYFVCSSHASLGMKGTIIVQSITGISENQLSESISIYPNPANDFINVKADSKMLGMNYKLIDPTGRQVLNGKLDNEVTSLDIRQFASGVYMFQLYANNEQIIRIIKK
jgi:plastocyanin